MKEVWRGDAAIDDLMDAAKDAMDVVIEVHRESANRTAPHEEGTMDRTSGTDVEVDRDTVVGIVFYTQKYARRQHEDLTVGEYMESAGVIVKDPGRAAQLVKHNPGRRAKWLELDLKEHGDDYIKLLGIEMAARTS